MAALYAETPARTRVPADARTALTLALILAPTSDPAQGPLNSDCEDVRR